MSGVEPRRGSALAFWLLMDRAKLSQGRSTIWGKGHRVLGTAQVPMRGTSPGAMCAAISLKIGVAQFGTLPSGPTLPTPRVVAAAMAIFFAGREASIDP